MKVIDFKERNTSKELLKQLKGKKFIALVIQNNGGHKKDYDYCLSESMPSEEIIYAANLLIKKILEEDESGIR